MELSKKDKKIAHELIDTGLHRELKKFNSEIKKLMQKTDLETTDQHELYLKLFNKVHKFNKHIAQRYDGLGGSRYFNTVFSLYCDEILTDDDIEPFSEEVKIRLTGLADAFK